MPYSNFALLILLTTIWLVGCGGGSGGSGSNTVTGSVVDSDADSDTDNGIDNDSIGNFDATLFSLQLTDETRVSCTLENGSSTTCYQLTFIANGVGDTEGNGTVGPFCPETITTPRSESGFGVYDGASNPGFQSIIDAAMNMELDGYDIVDDLGNINSVGGGGGASACLSMGFDSTLEITYLVPVTPELRSEPYDLGTIESIGFGLTGVPYKGNPPGVTIAEAGVGGAGSGSIPSLDHCGGHADPAGYYHWHFVPQSMNTVLDSDEYDFTDLYGVSCSNSFIDHDEPSAFAGIAKDGFPIYGAFDSVASVDTAPNDVVAVDSCNGHEHATDEFPDGVYHYHALETGAPNVPACLVGSFANNDFSVR